MNNTQKFLETFFEEKQLPYTEFEVMSDNGTPNFISNDVVIEHIKAAPTHEQKQIEMVLRKLDFMNGNVNHFLNYLAGALALDV